MSDDVKSKVDDVPGRFTSFLGMHAVPAAISGVVGRYAGESYAEDMETVGKVISTKTKIASAASVLIGIGALVAGYMGWKNSAKTQDNVKEFEVNEKINKEKITSLESELQSTKSFVSAEMSRRAEHPQHELKAHDSHLERHEDSAHEHGTCGEIIIFTEKTLRCHPRLKSGDDNGNQGSVEI